MRHLALLLVLGTIAVFACGEPSIEDKCEIVYDRLFDDCDQVGSYEGSIDACIRSYSADDCHTRFEALYVCVDEVGGCCEEEQLDWVFCFNEP